MIVDIPTFVRATPCNTKARSVFAASLNFGGGQRSALCASLRLRQRRYSRALPPLAVLICSAFLLSLRSHISAQIRHGTFSPKGSSPRPLANVNGRAFARPYVGGGHGVIDALCQDRVPISHRHSRLQPFSGINCALTFDFV